MRGPVSLRSGASASAIVVFAGLLAACGGSTPSRLSQSAYESKVRQVGGELSRGLKPASWVPGGTKLPTEAEIAALGRRVRAVIAAGKREIETLRPPKEAEAFNRALVGFLRLAETAEPKIAMAYATNDWTTKSGGFISFYTAPEVQALSRAARGLKEKGWKLGGLSFAPLGDSTVSPPRNTDKPAPPVAAVPLTLSSSGGVQDAVHLSAVGNCSTSCTLTKDWGAFHAPERLTVVRPGDIVRVKVGSPSARSFESMAAEIRDRCGDEFTPKPYHDLQRGKWAIDLPPGDYALAISFDTGAPDNIFEVGTVGLRVSAREPRRVIRAPRCSILTKQQLLATSPFAIESAAGRQHAIHLKTTEQKDSGSITATFSPSSHAPPPEQLSVLSVVRPGEILRFIRPSKPPGPYPSPPIVTVSRACGGTFLWRSAAPFFSAKGTWKAELPPGDYTLNIFTGWQVRTHQINETGTVGIRVSETARREIIKARAC